MKKIKPIVIKFKGLGHLPDPDHLKACQMGARQVKNKKAYTRKCKHPKNWSDHEQL